MNAGNQKDQTSLEPVVVIGAGISGLVAAGSLENQGLPVRVIEKARGVGGRMATRRLGAGVADHGAQFFTVRDPLFQDLVDGWIAGRAAREWTRGFVDPEGRVSQDGHPRFRGTQGMTGVPKWLAQPIDVRVHTRVEGLRATSERTWQVVLETGEVVSSPAVVLTPPLPQSLALLESGNIGLRGPLLTALEGIAYDPCVALIALLEKPSRIPGPGAVQFENGPLTWIADNQIKGISPLATAVTVHASPGFSRELWDLEDGVVAERMLAHCEGWLGSPPIDTQVHRWRYSKPSSLYLEKTALLSRPAPLAFAGDAFAGPKVEGAALSGLAAARALAQLMRALS